MLYEPATVYRELLSLLVSVNEQKFHSDSSSQCRSAKPMKVYEVMASSYSGFSRKEKTRQSTHTDECRTELGGTLRPVAEANGKTCAADCLETVTVYVFLFMTGSSRKVLCPGVRPEPSTSAAFARLLRLETCVRTVSSSWKSLIVVSDAGDAVRPTGDFRREKTTGCVSRSR